MIVLKYQESTTEKFFENAWTNLFFWGGGGPKKFKKNRCLVGSPNLYFMFSDRYEIHIQAFVHFSMEN